jgi:hypothetical protein
MELSIEVIERMATIGNKSGLFGVKTAEQAAALMLIAQAEGTSPALALRDYHVISGRPTLKADAILARFQQAGGKVRWLKLTEQEATAVFSHPAGGDVEINWTMEMARKAQLLGNGTWQKYSRAMLRSRCISEGVRTVYPGVVCGVYTPEEIESIDAAPVRIAATSSPAPAPVAELEYISAPEVTVQMAIASAETIEALRKAFTGAMRSAQSEDEKAELTALKDARKAQLESK